MELHVLLVLQALLGVSSGLTCYYCMQPINGTDTGSKDSGLAIVDCTPEAQTEQVCQEDQDSCLSGSYSYTMSLTIAGHTSVFSSHVNYTKMCGSVDLTCATYGDSIVEVFNGDYVDDISVDMVNCELSHCETDFCNNDSADVDDSSDVDEANGGVPNEDVDEEKEEEEDNIVEDSNEDDVNEDDAIVDDAIVDDAIVDDSNTIESDTSSYRVDDPNAVKSAASYSYTLSSLFSAIVLAIWGH